MIVPVCWRRLFTAIVVAFVLSFVWIDASAQVGDTRSDAELWFAIAAILTSVASGSLLKYGHALPDLAKQAVVGVVSILVTVGGSYFAGTLDLIDWPRTAMIVFLGATAVYEVIWKAIARPAMRGFARAK